MNDADKNQKVIDLLLQKLRNGSQPAHDEELYSSIGSKNLSNDIEAAPSAENFVPNRETIVSESEIGEIQEEKCANNESMSEGEITGSAKDESSSGSDDSNNYSSSDGDSVTSTDESSSDESDHLINGKTFEELLEEEDNDNEDKATAIPKTEHEIDLEIPPFQSETIDPNIELKILGDITEIVGTTVVVSTPSDTEISVLVEDSPVFNKSHQTVGKVFEVFGKVSNPKYTMKYRSVDEMDPDSILVGNTVYFAPQLSTYVFTNKLKAQKFTDASNAFDEELDEKDQEFSDDEKEAAFKKKNKKRKVNTKEK